jgi:hypothetical protein
MEESLRTSIVDSSVIITLSNGTKVGLRTLKDQPDATARMLETYVMALPKVVNDLDKRLAAIEGRSPIF